MNRFIRTSFAALIAVVTALGHAEEGPVATSVWGPEDTLGSVNRLTPEMVIEAARLVRTGKTYPLGVVSGASTPAYPPRRFAMNIIAHGDGTGATLGANKASSHDDLLITHMGIGSQIDGLGHLGTDHTYYNGRTADEFFTPNGLRFFGTDALPPIVTRGVLLDMTAQFGVDPLPPGTAINQAEIEAAARRQGITIREGDVVLLHTGWLPMADSDPAGFISQQPGLGLGGARYLAALGVVAIGADSAALEAIPHEDPTLAFPVHVELLAHNGIYILENMNTAALAADEAWEFLFVLGQPRFEGAVQAIINPVAIR